MTQLSLKMVLTAVRDCLASNIGILLVWNTRVWHMFSQSLVWIFLETPLWKIYIWLNLCHSECKTKACGLDKMYQWVSYCRCPTSALRGEKEYRQNCYHTAIPSTAWLWIAAWLKLSSPWTAVAPTHPTLCVDLFSIIGMFKLFKHSRAVFSLAQHEQPLDGDSYAGGMEQEPEALVTLVFVCGQTADSALALSHVNCSSPVLWERVLCLSCEQSHPRV